MPTSCKPTEMGLAKLSICDRGQQQTTNDTVGRSSLTKFEGSLRSFHKAEDNTQ